MRKTSKEKQWGIPAVSKLGKELYAKAAEISSLFPKNHPTKFVEAEPIDEMKIQSIDCPLRDVIVENNRSQVYRDCRFVLEDVWEQCVENLEKESVDVRLLN